MRCQNCQNLSISCLVSIAESNHHKDALFWPKSCFYAHHTSIYALERSAGLGCDLCQLLLHGLQQDETRPIANLYARQVSDIRLLIGAAHGEYSTFEATEAHMLDSLMLQAGEDEREWPNPTVFLLESPADTKLGRQLIGRNVVDPNLGATSNLNLARQWLADCCNEHTECPGDQEVQLPTRVIDIDLAGDHANPVPSLFVSDGTATGRYATLSHCWGGPIDIVLTCDRLRIFQQHLPEESLAKNFKDAIRICRELGIRYLWIDSLCILQDSRDDWLTESARMASVYRNAFVTISAISSLGSMHGILPGSILQENDQEYPNTGTKVSNVGIPLSPGSNTTVNLRLVKSARLEDLATLYTDAPLARRAWSLQESILSPRILYYGEDQIYWRCFNGFQAADGVPEESHAFPDELDIRLASALQGYSDVASRHRHDNVEIVGDHYKLIEEYSNRELTFPTDKLPAISGLTERIHFSLGGEYLAGLFTADLYQGLLWGLKDSAHKIEVKDDRPYRAPSWSWAAVDGPIKFIEVWSDDDVPKQQPKQQLNLFDCMIAYQDKDNPYGEVKPGSCIILSGLTRRLVYSRYEHEADPENSDYEAREFRMSPIWWDDRSVNQFGGPNSYATVEALPRGYGRGSVEQREKFFVCIDNSSWKYSDELVLYPKKKWPIRPELFFPEEYLVLLVRNFWESRFSNEDEEYGKADCLLLQNVDDDPPVNGDGERLPVYRRVGYLVLRYYGEAVDWEEKKVKLI